MSLSITSTVRSTLARFVPATATVARSFATARGRPRGRKAASKSTKPAGAQSGEQRTADEAALTEIISNARSNEDLNKVVQAIDDRTEEVIESTVTLPVKISGAHQEYVEYAYECGAQINKSNPIVGLEKIATQLQSFKDVVMEKDYTISRFFTEPDYLPKETQQALNLLMTDDVPLKSVDGIKDEELREYFIADDEGLQLWSDARNAVKRLKLSPQATDVLQKLANNGSLHYINRILDSLDMVTLAVSTTAKITVESAVELSASQKKDVQSALSKYIPEGKKDMDVQYVTDPHVIGGLCIHIDDRTVDLSSASLLMSMSAAVTESTAEQRA